MTKMEIMMVFDVSDVEEEKIESLDGILREKICKCDKEEYSSLCELMEEKGYYDVRLFPFCAKAEDDAGLKKALRWISDNSLLIKSLLEEYSVSIQLGVKFLVGDSMAEALGFFAGYPLELVFSPNDLELLKEHKIGVKLTAQYCDSIDD